MKAKITLLVLFAVVLAVVMSSINMTGGNAEYPPSQPTQPPKSMQEHMDEMDASFPQEVIPLVSSVCNRPDIWGNYPALFVRWGWPAAGTTSNQYVLFVRYWYKASWGDWVYFGEHYAYLQPWGWSNNNFWWVGSTDPFDFNYRYQILDAWVLDEYYQPHHADNVPSAMYFCPRILMPLIIR